MRLLPTLGTAIALQAPTTEMPCPACTPAFPSPSRTDPSVSTAIRFSPLDPRTKEEHIGRIVKAENHMERGQWSRWGRDMCERYALEIGDAFRGSVVRSDTTGMPSMWIASVNTTALGEYLERGAAMRRVEEVIEWSMQLVLHDWGIYQSTKGKR